MRLGIIADDLTGAMDSAAPFADRGARTRVVMDTGAAWRQPAWPADAVVAIDTHTRDLPAGPAAAAAGAATAAICQAGLVPFKKLDSALRGNVAAEIAAAAAASGRHCALVAPAAPAHGRFVRDDWLFVDGQRAGVCPFVEELRSSLPDWQVTSICAGELQRVAGVQRRSVFLVDTEAESGLDAVAALGLAHPDDVLLAGSSGLAGAVARRLHAGERAVARAQPACRRLWFVVGSHHRRSADQVRTLLARRDVARIVLPLSGRLPAIQPQHHEAAVGVLHVEALDAAAPGNAADIVTRLAQLAELLVGNSPEGETGLFMTGGDTARAVLARMGSGTIEVLGSRYPGVIHGAVSMRGRQFAIVTKSGGFGEPDLFVRAASDLLVQPAQAKTAWPRPLDCPPRNS